MKSQKIDKRNIVVPLTEGLESHMTPVKHFNLLREDVEDLTLGATTFAIRYFPLKLFHQKELPHQIHS